MKQSALSSSSYRNPDGDPRGPYVPMDLTSPGIRSRYVFDWHGFRPPNGRGWRYSAERLTAFEADRRIIFPAQGPPRLKRYLSEALGGEDKKAEHVASSKLELIVRVSMRAIAKLIADVPTALHRVEWRDLERVMREAFEALGFTTCLTRPGKDGGYDLELSCNERGGKSTFLVEVKHWTDGTKKPGMGVVSSFFDVVAQKGESTKGLLLSSSGFTREAVKGRTELQRERVRLGDAEKIVSLCQSYIQMEEGIWAPTTRLPDVLMDATL